MFDHDFIHVLLYELTGDQLLW